MFQFSQLHASVLRLPYLPHFHYTIPILSGPHATLWFTRLMGSIGSSKSLHSSLKSSNPGKKGFRVKLKSSISDQIDPVSNRQEGVMFSGLPYDYCTTPELICEAFKKLGILDVTPGRILPMKTRNGLPTGTVGVMTAEALPKEALAVFPIGTSSVLMDRHDMAMFVERCERLLTLSDDLRWLARPEHFDRIITITEIPSTYGRRELRDVLERYANVEVTPPDVVFQFDSFGNQTDVAWVVCPTLKDASRVLHKIQEVPVPERVQYASLFGCAFLWSYRSSVFITHEELDFQTHRVRSQVFVTGWEEYSSCEDFEALLLQLKFSPSIIKRVFNPASKTASFFLEFDTMKDARNAMVKFHKLKQEWRLQEMEILFAFPKLADVRWTDEETHADMDQEGDSDIEDPIES